jgi:hypothetical protein
MSQCDPPSHCHYSSATARRVKHKHSVPASRTSESCHHEDPGDRHRPIKPALRRASELTLATVSTRFFIRSGYYSRRPAARPQRDAATRRAYRRTQLKNLFGALFTVSGYIQRDVVLPVRVGGGLFLGMLVRAACLRPSRGNCSTASQYSLTTDA